MSDCKTLKNKVYLTCSPSFASAIAILILKNDARNMSVNYRFKADFQNVARSTFSERFLSNYKQISLAVVDFTHFKRKRSLKIDRATFCTEWKSAFSPDTGRNCSNNTERSDSGKIPRI